MLGPVDDPKSALLAIQQKFGINTKNWTYINQRKYLLRSSESGEKLAFYRVDVAKMSDIGIMEKLNCWQTTFAFSNLLKRSFVLWHLLSDREMLRLLLLGTLVEISPEYIRQLPSNHQIAVGEEHLIRLAYNNPAVKNRVRAILTDDGVERLTMEMELLGIIDQGPLASSMTTALNGRAIIQPISSETENRFLATEPADTIQFVATSTDEQKTTLKITNQSEMKQAFKVKCTNNDSFRIDPSTGVLDVNQTVTVSLTFKAGQAKPIGKQQFGVYHVPLLENDTCEGAWSKHHGPPQGEHKLRVVWNE